MRACQPLRRLLLLLLIPPPPPHTHQDLAYGTPGVLGYARTWPQAAAGLPQPGPAFDWEGDRPLGLPMEDLVIYECHVRGFTADASSGVTAPGTFRGMVERLDYLQARRAACALRAAAAAPKRSRPCCA